MVISFSSSAHSVTTHQPLLNLNRSEPPPAFFRSLVIIGAAAGIARRIGFAFSGIQASRAQCTAWLQVGAGIITGLPSGFLFCSAVVRATASPTNFYA
jgi:hypothetical protein